MRLCIKRFYFHVCALFFFRLLLVSPAPKKKKKKKKKRYVSQNLILGILYSLSVFETLYVFYQTLSVTNLVLGGVTFRESRICRGNHMILSAIWNK